MWVSNKIFIFFLLLIKSAYDFYLFGVVSLTGSIMYSEVRTFLHKDPDLITKYKAITTFDSKSIILSGNHLLHARKISTDRFFPM